MIPGRTTLVMALTLAAVAVPAIAWYLVGSAEVERRAASAAPWPERQHPDFARGKILEGRGRVLHPDLTSRCPGIDPAAETATGPQAGTGNQVDEIDRCPSLGGDLQSKCDLTTRPWFEANLRSTEVLPISISNSIKHVFKFRWTLVATRQN